MFILERIISYIAPHICQGCGQTGSLFCEGCAAALPSLPSRCYGCAALSVDSAVCPVCRRRSPLRHVWVVTPYEGVAKELLYALKFERAGAASRPMALLMAEALPHLSEGMLVVPVPTANVRVRQRGYDQALLLARQIAKQRGYKCTPLLARTGHTRQVGADKAHRQKQLADAFRPLSPDKIRGARVVLVDDIVTTGATLESAARALKKAGAKSIDAIVFAQK